MQLKEIINYFCINHFKQQKYEYFYTYDLNNNSQNGFVLTQGFSKKFGWTINNTSQQMSGLEEALNDVKTGNVFHANSAKDLIEQCLK